MMDFQSPFYRVFECNVNDLAKALSGDDPPFSPLSIGSLSVTVPDYVRILPDQEPFSPLSIGSLSVTY